MALSDALALFKTYAIPTISSVSLPSQLSQFSLRKAENCLTVQTLSMAGELTNPTLAGRRAEDTAIFVIEFLTSGLDSERGNILLARMNWLHARWGKLIKRDDLLFTLSLFIFEPIIFVEQYEWRPMCELEKQAQFLYWAEIGARMGIADIPKTIDELWEWKEEYAATHMVPSNASSKIGEVTMDVLVAPFPTFLKPLGKQASKVFVEPRVLKAFGWGPARPAMLYWALPALLHLRAFLLRNLIFPRTKEPKFMTMKEVDLIGMDGTVDKRVQRDGFLLEPWYVPAGQSRVGKLGIGVPGDKIRWQSEGYKPESMGPDNLKGEGVETVIAEGKRIREAGLACPFFRP